MLDEGFWIIMVMVEFRMCMGWEVGMSKNIYLFCICVG